MTNFLIEDEEEDDENGCEGFPANIDEAIDAFIDANLSERDWEIIGECPVGKIDRLLPDFEPIIRKSCGLNYKNITLLRACGDNNMDPHDAVKVIMFAIWDYFHGTQ